MRRITQFQSEIEELVELRNDMMERVDSIVNTAQDSKEEYLDQYPIRMTELEG